MTRKMTFSFLISIAMVILNTMAATHADDPKIPRPAFSWDRVPVYQMFGDNNRLLTDSEVEKISSSTRFLCIEKQHGNRTLGGAELGAAHEIARFKKLDPKTTGLFYFNSAYAYPFTTGSKRFRFGQVTEEDRSFLLKEPGKEELARRGRTYFFDVLNPDFRKWWVNKVGRYVKESGADGLFVDQMHGFSFLRPKEQGPRVAQAQAEMMAMAKKSIGPDEILLLNNAAHIPALFTIGDSFMFEHYNAKFLTKEAILRDWDLMKKISKAGKSSVWRIGVEVEHGGKEIRLTSAGYEKLAKENLEFYLAAFLVGAQPYSFFQYGWGWRLDTGPLVKYPELKRRLGKPLGPRVRTDPKRWAFTREFEHASVSVDLKNRKANVSWR